MINKTNKYEYIFFDLDGTLTDPGDGLISGFAYALKKTGVDYGDRSSLSRFIGPPLRDEFIKVYGFSTDEANECVRLFREYFSVYGWWDNKMYDGVPEMLSSLKSKGKSIVLATSKPKVFAEKILRLFNIDVYFDFIGAATLDHTRVEKTQVLMHSIESIGASNALDKCILIGDRMFDAKGAQECGIDSMGVLYGYGSYDEIYSSGFNYIAANIKDITEILL